MNSIGKKAVCLEVGSIVDDLDLTVSIARKHLLNFLSAVGNKHQSAIQFVVPRVVTCRSIYHARFGAFDLIVPFTEFAEVTKGTLIGIDGEVSVHMPEDGFLLFSRNTREVGEECFVVVQEL